MLDRPTRPPGEGAGSPAVRRGAPASGPPPTLHLELLNKELLHLKLLKPPRPQTLEEGSGNVDLEQFCGTKEDDLLA